MEARSARQMGKRGTDHGRPQIGPANTDIDDIGNMRSAHTLRKGRKTGKFVAVDTCGAALRHMDNCAPFTDIHRLTREQRADLVGQSAAYRKGLKLHHDGVDQKLARQINPQIVKLPDKPTCPCCIVQKRSKLLLPHNNSHVLQGVVNGGIGIHDRCSLTKMYCMKCAT